MTYLSTILADTPQNVWPLNETSGTTAIDVVLGDNGTTSGAVTVGSAGFVDGDTAYLFAGTNSNQVVATIPAAGGNAQTVECWVNTTNVSANQMLMMNGNGFGWGLFILANGNLGINNANILTDTGVAYTRFGSWAYVVMVYGGSATNQFTIYIDSVQVFTASIGTGAPFGLQFIIGEFSPTSQGFGFHAPLAGSIQFVALYNYALSAAQLLTHYNAGLNLIGVRMSRQVVNSLSTVDGDLNLSRLAINPVVTIDANLRMSREVINPIVQLQSSTRMSRMVVNIVIRTNQLVLQPAWKHWHFRI